MEKRRVQRKQQLSVVVEVTTCYRLLCSGLGPVGTLLFSDPKTVAIGPSTAGLNTCSSSFCPIIVRETCAVDTITSSFLKDGNGNCCLVLMPETLVLEVQMRTRMKRDT